MQLSTKQTILMVSKPVAPPWNDSSKNLVKDLVTCGHRFAYRVLVPQGFQLDAPGVTSEPLYRRGSAFSPPLAHNARVLARVLRRDDAALTHFFFAPNPRSSAAARLALALRPRITVQTVCSTPARFDGVDRLLFAGRVVVVSQHTRQRLEAAGVAPQRLRVIPPGIQIPARPDPDQRALARARYGLPRDRPVVVFPGDYQFSGAAENFIHAAGLLAARDSRVVFVLACRPKQRASLDAERSVLALARSLGIRDRVRSLGQVPDMLQLLAASDLCALVTKSLYAKMDLPLVLLESMALAVPLVVSDQPPLAELIDDPGVGLGVPAGDPPALAAAMGRLLSSPEALTRMGQRARQVAQRRYDIQAVARQYEDLYQQLLQPQRAT